MQLAVQASARLSGSPEGPEGTVSPMLEAALMRAAVPELESEPT